MNIFLAIIVTIALLIVTSIAMSYAGPIPGLGVMAVTAIWAGIDVSRLKFSKYKVAFPGNSLLAVLFVLMVWLIGFPLFLAAWIAITRKTAKPHTISATA